MGERIVGDDVPVLERPFDTWVLGRGRRMRDGVGEAWLMLPAGMLGDELIWSVSVRDRWAA